LAKPVGIEKNVTIYVARHSYASALGVNGLSEEIIGQSLGTRILNRWTFI